MRLTTPAGQLADLRTREPPGEREMVPSCSHDDAPWEPVAVRSGVPAGAARRGAHLVFLDESGFLLIPNVRKTGRPGPR